MPKFAIYDPTRQRYMTGNTHKSMLCGTGVVDPIDANLYKSESRAETVLLVAVIQMSRCDPDNPGIPHVTIPDPHPFVVRQVFGSLSSTPTTGTPTTGTPTTGTPQ